jgi:hypothetical protein
MIIMHCRGIVKEMVADTKVMQPTVLIAVPRVLNKVAGEPHTHSCWAPSSSQSSGSSSAEFLFLPVFLNFKRCL